jgi:flagellar basal-body rod protein FlgB
MNQKSKKVEVMGYEISRSAALASAALDYRAARQDMIASNIANADTPGYQPRDIRFEEALAAKKAEIFNEHNQELKMAQTDRSHLQPKHTTSTVKPILYFRDGHTARNDGNSVDIDVETTEMSKNSVMFNAIVMAKKKDTAIFRSVIEASQKVN